MTEATFQQLQKIIENLKLPVDKADLILGLKNRLDKVRPVLAEESIAKIATSAPPSLPNIPEKTAASSSPPTGDTSDSFQEALMEKLKMLEASLAEMRQIISIKSEASLQFDKITDKRVLTQLRSDNARMEHALVSLEIFPDFDTELAFRRFCAFAFFQIEELLNYYYHKKFQHRMTELRRDFISRGIVLKHIENAKKVSDIRPWVLINAYNHEFFESKGGKKTWGLDNLRNIRNLEEHRCSVLLKDNSLIQLENSYNEEQKKPKPDGKVSQAYFTLKYIVERDHVGVRKEIENLYKNVTKTDFK